jgi:hypothetical protein
MTLAKILFTSIGGLAWTFSVWTADAPHSPQTDSSTPRATNVEQQSGSVDPQAPAEVKPSTPGESSSSGTAQSKASAKRAHRNKKKKTVACTDTPSTSAANEASSPSSPSSGQANAGKSPAVPVASSENCPPAKVVVHQGGSSESSIQLAGGTNQSSQARATATPMLDATEANLKVLEERQLSDSEKDMVTQIRQFMEQSKTAVAAGDVERARTLAWKAQTLSDDLVKPTK